MYYEKMYHNMDYFHFRLDESFAMHFQNTVEIVYVLEGEVEVTVEDRTDVIGEGSMALVFPYQSHEYRIEKARCFLAVASPECFVSLENVIRTEAPRTPFYTFTGAEANVLESMISVMKAMAASDGELEFHPLNDLCRKSQLTSIAAFYLDRVGSEHIRPQPDVPIIKKAMQLMEANYLDPEFSIEKTAREIGVTRQHLSNIMRTHTGCTVLEMLHRMRIEYSLNLLHGTVMPISEIALAGGFSSIRNFNRVFEKLMGMTPGEYRRVNGKNSRL